MAGIKLLEQSEMVARAELQSEKMSDAFHQMQSHKLETDKLLESYNERFSECQHSIEKSNEVGTFCIFLGCIQTCFSKFLGAVFAGASRARYVQGLCFEKCLS